MIVRSIAIAALAMTTAASVQAAAQTYNVTTIFFEPETQPKDTVFQGTFDYDAGTHTVSNLQGLLSESMTGADAASMSWITLGHQLVSWYDASLGGTFAAAFSKNVTATFLGGTWTPADGVDAGGVFDGGPAKKNYVNSTQNSYALIFVPDNPLQLLNQAQIDRLAYADCAPGGMMGAVCMSGTSAFYGGVGTMGGFPVSRSITAAVPEPSTWVLALTGMALAVVVSRRRRC